MSPVIPDLVSDMFIVYINFAVDKQLVSRLISLFLLLDYLEKQSMLSSLLLAVANPQPFSFR